MSLKYVAAYLMSVTAGNNSPKSSEITTILGAIGADIDNELVNKILSEMSGKSVHEVIASGLAKLQTVPTGGSGGGTSAVGASAAVVEETKVPEPEEEEEEEEDMGLSLFG